MPDKKDKVRDLNLSSGRFLIHFEDNTFVSRTFKKGDSKELVVQYFREMADVIEQTID